MSKIITTKRIRITSRGRYPHKKGIFLGPERFFHKEEVSTIGELLSTYPSITIEEHVKENNNIVILNKENYNTGNYRPPVSMEGDGNGGTPENTDSGKEDLPESTEHENPEMQAEVIPEETAENGNDVVIDDTIIGNSPEMQAETTQSTEVATEVNEEEPVQQNNNQQNGGQQQKNNNQPQKKDKNKNKNRNQQNGGQQQNQNSTEVTPKEA